MGSYVYPYTDFARDIDAVMIPLNAADHDEMQQMMRVRHHVQAMYPSEVDRVERGSALMISMSYMQRHAAEFDTGRVAVRGEGCSIITEHLLRAVHALVCFAAIELRPPPKPSEVIKLAEIYEKEPST